MSRDSSGITKIFKNAATKNVAEGHRDSSVSAVSGEAESKMASFGRPKVNERKTVFRVFSVDPRPERIPISGASSVVSARTKELKRYLFHCHPKPKVELYEVREAVKMNEFAFFVSSVIFLFYVPGFLTKLS